MNYFLKSYFEYVQDYLIEKLNSWIYENVDLILHSVFTLENCKKLRDYCLEFICKDPLPFINKAKWNEENYQALKKTLNQFILLIQFVKISRADFFDKVRPYKVIIPNDIYDEIEEFYYKDTLPKNSSPRKVYKFDLIYRGSRDGINNETFKDYCNGRVASLVLIKVQNSNKIFGGYSSIGFNSVGDGYLDIYGIVHQITLFSHLNMEKTHKI
ncbi:hypothetical protein GLOIN_2v1470534 [Rhizophagus irregularis DAOM 181602=DAOM 197198]|nr:hypothetical protein GLOIN_2v1470534 [Rhizophagus irregularis DAOM 181602=DAOM 197198]